METETEMLAELISGGLVEEIAEAAHRNRVMITITVTPYDDETGAGE